ncbi:MAG: L,D-transpeptidase [Bacillota bacterium]|uniref:L,D-transpeptidase catalytic domain n=2 Tax=Carboxydocella TaxID=178898 RepID=A0A1T4NLK8_9FIRM|nr:MULTISPECIES: L,D-transpeptidase [Carboxydocella]AVX20095.1 L,D-transpeptidase catalytic domain [Carboxydocella thermautotrophica]AVX30512.1 L,D-transpeptidase catalytic domain [Carboxydocella thermautotrophica]SJZ80006.1 L,D-transpeptidase catalytic domain [Carboxydocella sporoproducens DSM 16521]GAW27830.1 hypothetical protein ULO1_04000 [Carboxydocella sp. ULO1]GAW31742.1 hypothetical protein JDF658_15070 [Carboxydocella sp. JDF658]
MNGIYISLSVRKLYLLQNGKPLAIYPIAIGKPQTPTPQGNFRILEKIINPGGILGSRWLTFHFVPRGKYGIHGTNNPASIGLAVSNGCVRLHNQHIEELFSRVSIWTPVWIRSEPWSELAK